MNTLLVLLQKEFKQISRNTLILRMIIAMPIVQLLVMPLAADYEIKNHCCPVNILKNRGTIIELPR